jgi:hypothetical protein
LREDSAVRFGADFFGRAFAWDARLGLVPMRFAMAFCNCAAACFMFIGVSISMCVQRCDRRRPPAFGR